MIRPLIGPSTTVRVCQSIPLDNTYTDTILFTSKSAQESYFASKTKKTYSGLTYQRLASNSSTWAIFLEDVADYFYDCNYLCFQNGGFGNKWLYAFISDICISTKIARQLLLKLMSCKHGFSILKLKNPLSSGCMFRMILSHEMWWKKI